MYKSKPSEFQMAIEEALLAENDIVETSLGTGQMTIAEAYPDAIQEAVAFNGLQELNSESQASSLKNLFLLFPPFPFYLGVDTSFLSDVMGKVMGDYCRRPVKM